MKNLAKNQKPQGLIFFSLVFSLSEKSKGNKRLISLKERSIESTTVCFTGMCPTCLVSVATFLTKPHIPSCGSFLAFNVFLIAPVRTLSTFFVLSGWGKLTSTFSGTNRLIQSPSVSVIFELDGVNIFDIRKALRDFSTNSRLLTKDSSKISRYLLRLTLYPFKDEIILNKTFPQGIFFPPMVFKRPT